MNNLTVTAYKNMKTLISKHALVIDHKQIFSRLMTNII